MTRWRPDTCGCEIEFDTDLNAGTHTGKQLIKTCLAHADAGDAKQHLTKLLDENRRKNTALAEITKDNPPVTFEVDVTNPSARLVPAVQAVAGVVGVSLNNSVLTVKARGNFRQQIEDAVLDDGSTLGNIRVSKRYDVGAIRWQFDAQRNLEIILPAKFTPSEKSTAQAKLDSKFGAGKAKVL